MSGEKKWTRRAAVGLIGAGAGLFALDTNAATQIYSDRGVNFDTTEDPEALLPLADRSGDAKISGSDDEATIYTIEQSDVDWRFSDSTDISDIQHVSGDSGVDRDDVSVSADGNAIVLSCSESDFSGEYVLTLSVRARTESEDGLVSVTAGRKTQTIPIDCRPFYAIPNNYSDNRDNGSGIAPQPAAEDARGVVSDSSNIGRDDESVATIGNPEQGGGDGNVSLRVGFRFPTVEPAECYTLTVKMSDGQGNLRVFLKDEDGNQLSNKRKIRGGDDFDFDGTVTIQDNERDTRVGEADSVFLIFEGEGNNTHGVEFIGFESGCG